MSPICHQCDALELKRKRKDKIRRGVVESWLLMVVDVMSVNTTYPELVFLTVLKLAHFSACLSYIHGVSSFEPLNEMLHEKFV